MDNNTEATIIGTRGNTPINIVLPEKLGEYTVRTIGDKAFYEYSVQGDLIIPNSVIDIGISAFSGCRGLNGKLVLGTSLTTIGANAFKDCSNIKGALTIPSNVTSIGSGAFLNCSGFSGTLTIPSSVIEMNEQAFVGCTGLSQVINNSSCSVELPNCEGKIWRNASTKAIITSIANGTAIREDEPQYTLKYTVSDGKATITGYMGTDKGNLIIPEIIDGYPVTAIGENAFSSRCNFNGELIIPNGVIDIGDHAFSGCWLMRKLTIPNSVKNIGAYAFYSTSFNGDLTIPDSVQSIGVAAFCDGYFYGGKLIIGNGVTSIGASAFKNCSHFTGDLVIGNSVTSIGASAFEGCSGFDGNLNIPEGVTSIGSRAFYGCAGLSGNLYIPDSVISIGSRAFENACMTCDSISFPGECSLIGGFPFYGYTGELIYRDAPENITLEYSVTDNEATIIGYSGKTTRNLVIPNYIDGYPITTIADNAFRGCPFTGSLVIGNNVTYIGSYAFAYCDDFSGELILGNSVKNIKVGAFFNCLGLTGDLFIPKSIKEIRENAFTYSGFTGTLTIPGSVEILGAGSFWGCDGLTRINNNTTKEILLSSPENHFWIDKATGETVTRFGKGIVIRDDYTEEGVAEIEGTKYSVNYSVFGNCATITGCTGDITGELKIPSVIDGYAVTAIGNGAFSDCNGFTGTLFIPENIKTIGELAFSDCSGFSGSMEIPNTIEAIESNALAGCIGLTRIVNNSNCSLMLPFLDGKTWHEKATRNDITTLQKGVAIRNDNIPSNPCTVTFDSQGGTLINPINNVEAGDIIELPTAPTKEGACFKGWYTAKGGNGRKLTETTPILDNIKVYAYWKNTYTVFFDSQGGSEVAAKENIEEGFSVELPSEPTKDKNLFKGWYAQPNGQGLMFTENTPIMSNVVVYAYWKQLFTVTFDSQGGSFVEPKSKIEEGNTIQLPEDPEKEEMVFAGWFIEPGGKGRKFTKTTSVKCDTTVFAYWRNKPGVIVEGLEEWYEYTGTQIKPQITVRESGVLLTEGTDYTVAYKNSVNASDKSASVHPLILISGKGNFAQNVAVPFTIVPKSIGTGTAVSEGFSVTIPDKQYSGSTQKAVPLVSYGKTKLKENKDYTIKYYSDKNCETEVAPKNPKQYYVKISGIGNFTGNIVMPFNIYEKGTGIAAMYVASIPNQTYTGTDIDLDTIPITVKETKKSTDSMIRGEGGDYIVSYAPGFNARNAGTATILLTGISDRCIGSRTVTFKIVPKALTADMFDVGEASYTGSALKPEVTMTDVGVTVDASNYTVSYSKNVDAADVAAKNAPTATIKGRGNYIGTVKIPFSITPLELDVGDLDISMSDIKDNGKTITEAAVKPVVKYANHVTGKTVTLKKGKDYSIDYVRGDDDNNQTAKIILKGNYANRQGDDIAFNFRLFKSQTVLNTEDFSVEITDSDISYTGNKITPAVTVNERTEGEPRILQEGKDFTVSYSNNINAADKDLPDANVKKLPTVKITGKGLYKGTVSKTFTIGKKVLSEDDFDIVIEDVKCNPNKNQVPKVTITNKAIGKALKKTDYTVEIKGTTMAPKEENGIVITGKGNYGGEPLNLTFRVYGKNISSAIFDKIENQSYTGDQICPDGDSVKMYLDQKKTVKLEEGVDYRLEYGTNVKTGTGTINVIGLGEFGGTKKLTFKIVPMKMEVKSNDDDSRNDDKYKSLASILCKDGTCYVTAEQLVLIHQAWDFARDAIEMAGHHNIGELEAVIEPTVH